MKRLSKSSEIALSTMYRDKVGDTIKSWEVPFDISVSDEAPFIVRLDGVSFSKFTRGMDVPFDLRLTESMVKTAIDLSCRFSPLLTYHQSDEISLVFPTSKDSSSSAIQSHFYSGRVQKISSVIAAYASIRLNFHLNQCNWSTLPKNISDKITSHTAHFDGRTFSCSSLTSAMECIYWRSNFDGLRNCISQISQSHFSHKELMNKSVINQLEMLEKKNIYPFQHYSPRILYGTWLKKEQFYLKDAFNPKTNQSVGPVLRNRWRTGSFNWADFSPDNRVDFVSSKLWNDTTHPPKDPINEDPFMY